MATPTVAEVDLAIAARMLTIRPDGRYDVADDRVADSLFGCQADDWCILQDGHPGDCAEDREVHVTTADLATPPVCAECGVALSPRPVATQTATQKATGGWWDHPSLSNQSMVGHTTAVNLPPTRQAVFDANRARFDTALAPYVRHGNEPDGTPFAYLDPATPTPLATAYHQLMQ